MIRRCRYIPLPIGPGVLRVHELVAAVAVVVRRTEDPVDNVPRAVASVDVKALDADAIDRHRRVVAVYLVSATYPLFTHGNVTNDAHPGGGVGGS